MKRIIKLRGELLILLLISLVVSLTIAITIRNQGIGLHSKSPNYRLKEIYSECITSLEQELKNSDLNNSLKTQHLLDIKYRFKVGYSFYVVDESGKVIAGTNNGVRTIDKDELTNPKQDYFTSKTDKNVFQITGCDYLKDGYYLYYVYLRYEQDDTGMVVYALVAAILCFFLLIWGRISYISTIKASVAVIAEGDLTHRVPLKYKNELRELAEDINDMASELEKEDQKKNEFITNISHDIRTPLTTILGYVDMIKSDKYDSKEELMRYVDVMERKGQFLATMMEDFFQYSKLTSKDIILKEEDFELNELARQLSEEEESSFLERGLRLELELWKDPVYMKGDIDFLVRAITNLLSNARKYSKPHTIVTIQISKEKQNNTNYGVLSLSNIPNELVTENDLHNFFERLYKKDSSRNGEGSGLGLSIANNIVKLHGGILRGKKEGNKIFFQILLRLQ